MEKFNHYMMTLARDARGLTQTDLADRLRVQQGTVSKYETGFHEPPTEFVDALSDALGYPNPFFFEPGRPHGLPPFHYRRRKKLSSRALARIIAEMNIRRLHLSKLLVSFSWSTNRFIPELDLDDYQGKSRGRLLPEQIATQIREMWSLPDGPIPNMIELIEDNGGIVIQCDFGSDLIDAISQRIEGMPVLFFVNISAPMDRLRMTLAHELGHMVLHTVTVKSDDAMEDEADEFAGAFLLPAHEIRSQLRRFDLRQISNLKLYWKVSMAAIAVRADRLGVITPYQSKAFWIEMGKLGYRKREPNEPPRETPSLLRQMISFHMKKLGYSLGEMAKLLHLKVDEYQEMYRSEILGDPRAPIGGRPQLRIVK